MDPESHWLIYGWPVGDILTYLFWFALFVGFLYLIGGSFSQTSASPHREASQPDRDGKREEEINEETRDTDEGL